MFLLTLILYHSITRPGLFLYTDAHLFCSCRWTAAGQSILSSWAVGAAVTIPEASCSHAAPSAGALLHTHSHTQWLKSQLVPSLAKHANYKSGKSKEVWLKRKWHWGRICLCNKKLTACVLKEETVGEVLFTSACSSAPPLAAPTLLELWESPPFTLTVTALRVVILCIWTSVTKTTE